MNADATIRAVDGSVAQASAQSGIGGDANPRAREDAERLARYRLVIEQGSRAGSFVYKTLDRETGEVLRQLPSEEVTRLQQQGLYGPGKVIDTTV